MKKHCKMISVESLRYLAHFLPDGEKLISLPRQFPNKNIVTKRSGSETPLLQNQVKLCPLLHNFVFRQVFLKPATGHNSRSSRIAMKDQRRSSIIRKLGEWHSWLAGVPSRRPRRSKEERGYAIRWLVVYLSVFMKRPGGLFSRPYQ